MNSKINTDENKYQINIIRSKNIKPRTSLLSHHRTSMDNNDNNNDDEG